MKDSHSRFQVTNIPMNSAAKSTNDFLTVFAEIIQSCCQPLCMAWLEEELCLISRKPDKARCMQLIILQVI